MPFIAGPRKVDRDEHGDPVYHCSWIGCNKSFGSAQHARRHEKSHSGSTPYPCPHCEKQFVRSDVRAKHVQTMHGDLTDHSSQAQVRIAGTKRAREREGTSISSDTPSSTRAKMEQLPSPSSSHPSITSPLITRPRADSLNMTWIEQQQQPLLVHSQHISTQGMVGGSLDSTLFSPASMMGNPNLMLPPPTPYSGNSVDSGFLDPSLLSTGPSVIPIHDGVGGVPSYLDPWGTTWDAFGQAFGWGFENDLDLGIGLQNGMFDNSDIGPVSSTDTLSAAWLLSMTPRTGSPVGDGKAPPTMESEQRTDPFGRKHDNPWPNIFKPKVPDRPLTLGGVKASPRQGRDGSSEEKINKTSRNAMLSLIYLSHQNLWLMPDIGDFPDHETLSDFVDLYFENFHPTFPILHKPSFSDETPAILLLSVAAVGATYAEKSVQPLAVALSELVRRIVTWMRASDQRSKFDRYALMAYVLQAALDIACGSREMFLHAEIMRCSISTTCRRLYLLRPVKTATEELFSQNPKPSLESRWKAYIEDEGRRRLGWGIFLLDSQMAALLGHPCMIQIVEAQIPLPGDDAGWNAPTALAWAKLAPTPPIPSGPSFPQTMAQLLRGDKVELLDFASAIVSHTLYRFLMDAYQLSNALEADDETADLNMTSYLPAKLEAKPRKTLLNLAANLFPLASPSHLRLCSAALFHHSFIAFARPGLLENIKAASGSALPGLKRKTSIEWLRRWARNGTEVRSVLWHAGVLNSILAEFPRGALSELFWTFDCALVMWAIVKYAPDQLTGSELRSALFAANWFDTEPPLVWLQHSGQLMLPYLGSSTNLSVNSTLTFFMNRLETIPWGWASLFRQVLSNLMNADDERGSEEAE